MVVAMADYLRRASRMAAPTTPSTRRPCARVTAPTRSQTRAGCACGDGPRRSLLRAVRRRARAPDVPADLRAEITASGHLAGVTYAGGHRRCGDLATLRRVGRARARGEPGTVRGDAAGEHGRRARARARARRWTGTSRWWTRGGTQRCGAPWGALEQVRARVQAATGTSPQAEEGLCDDESGPYQHGRDGSTDGYEDFVAREGLGRDGGARVRPAAAAIRPRSSRTSASSWSGRAARALPRCSRPSGPESRASNWRLRARSEAQHGRTVPDRRAARSAPGVQARRGGDGASPSASSGASKRPTIPGST